MHPGMHRAQQAAVQHSSTSSAAVRRSQHLWRLPHAARPSPLAIPACHAAMNGQNSPAEALVVRATPPGGDGEEAAMTAEEEAAYEAHKQHQKEVRLQKRSEYKRRRNFDPLASRYAEKGAGTGSAVPAVLATGNAPATTISSSSGSNAGSAGGNTGRTPAATATAAARPRMPTGALMQRQPNTAAAAATPALTEQTAAPVSAAPLTSDTTSDTAGEGMTDGAGDDAIDFEAVVRQQLAGVAVPEAQVMMPTAPKRRTPAQLRAAAAGRLLAKEAQQDTMKELAAMQQLAKAVAQSTSDNVTDDAASDDDDDDDELDWDALGQYEAFESYVSKQKREQAAAAARDAARRSSGSSTSSTTGAASSSGSRTSSSSGRAVGTAPAARPRVPPAARIATATTPASSAATTAGAAAAAAGAAGPAPAAKAGQKQGAIRRKGRASALSVDGKSKLERELDEMEQLVGFFEALERQGSAGPSKTGRQQPRAAAAADAEEWAAVEKLLLGDGWEEELWAALAEEGEEGIGAEAAAAVGGGYEGSEEEAKPWADEVTTLLLGLVTISYKKYLDKPLHNEPVDEDARARYFWDAPYALLVHDDSPESRIEYANAAACKLLGRSYLDLFGMPSHEIIAPTATAQEDWAFALKEVEDGFSRTATVPSLELAGADEGRMVAKDVLVWRVDSLEDDAIGQAVLIKDWQPL